MLTAALERALLLRSGLSTHFRKLATSESPTLMAQIDLLEGSEQVVDVYEHYRITLERVKTMLESLLSLTDCELAQSCKELDLIKTLSTELRHSNMSGARARAILGLLGEHLQARQTNESDLSLAALPLLTAATTPGAGKSKGQTSTKPSRERSRRRQGCTE